MSWRSLRWYSTCRIRWTRKAYMWQRRVARRMWMGIGSCRSRNCMTSCTGTGCLTLTLTITITLTPTLALTLVLCRHRMPVPAVTPAKLQALVRLMDVNGDNAIDYAEFAGLFEARRLLHLSCRPFPASSLVLKWVPRTMRQGGNEKPTRPDDLKSGSMPMNRGWKRLAAGKQI